MLINVAAFIFVLGVLIFIHELGHFLVAKKVGIRVEKFSLGFPPNIFAKKIGETTYCIGVIPLGGFVKMVGENPDEELTGADYEYSSKKIWERALVIFAGPLMNYLLAIVILIGSFFIIGTPVFDESKIVVGVVVAESPADQAGIKPGNEIIGINGVAVSNFDSLRVQINKVLNDTVMITWVSESDTVSAGIITKATEIQLSDGSVDSVGQIGFQPTFELKGYEAMGFTEAVKTGISEAHLFVVETIKFVKRLITTEESSKNVGGPIFIFEAAGQAAERGLYSLFRFMALLSINLAVLNVLPIPVLDGGHLVFLGVEKVKGSPLSLKTRMILMQIGMIGLLGFILYVTYNDILRAFS